MRRLTSYARIAQELPPIGARGTTRDGQFGEVIAHDGNQFIMQFARSVQGKFYADEVTLEARSSIEQESKWQTTGAELHFARDDYPELDDILNQPAPALVQEGDGWGRTASKTATHQCPGSGQVFATAPFTDNGDGLLPLAYCPVCDDQHTYTIVDRNAMTLRMDSHNMDDDMWEARQGSKTAYTCEFAPGKPEHEGEFQIQYVRENGEDSDETRRDICNEHHDEMYSKFPEGIVRKVPTRPHDE